MYLQCGKNNSTTASTVHRERAKSASAHMSMTVDGCTVGPPPACYQSSRPLLAIKRSDPLTVGQEVRREVMSNPQHVFSLSNLTTSVTSWASYVSCRPLRSTSYTEGTHNPADLLTKTVTDQHLKLLRPSLGGNVRTSDTGVTRELRLHGYHPMSKVTRSPRALNHCWDLCFMDLST